MLLLILCRFHADVPGAAEAGRGRHGAAAASPAAQGARAAGAGHRSPQYCGEGKYLVNLTLWMYNNCNLGRAFVISLQTHAQSAVDVASSACSGPLDFRRRFLLLGTCFPPCFSRV